LRYNKPGAPRLRGVYLAISPHYVPLESLLLFALADSGRDFEEAVWPALDSDCGFIIEKSVQPLPSERNGSCGYLGCIRGAGAHLGATATQCYSIIAAGECSFLGRFGALSEENTTLVPGKYTIAQYVFSLFCLLGERLWFALKTYNRIYVAENGALRVLRGLRPGPHLRGGSARICTG
jgi:hypothetical protein